MNVPGFYCVYFIYVPVASLAEQVMRLVNEIYPVPAKIKDAFHKILPGPGKDVPIAGISQVYGSRLALNLQISPDLVGMIAKTALVAMRSSGKSLP